MHKAKERDPQKVLDTIEKFGLWVALGEEHVETSLKYWIKRCMKAEGLITESTEGSNEYHI